MKNKHRLNLANIITLIRIFGALLLITTKPLSALFFIVYSITGITDVLDGWIARKTQTESKFGSKLDSIADIVFYGVTSFKIMPSLLRVLTMPVWYIISVVLLLRIISYVVAFIKYYQFASLHTYMNKLTGFLIFTLPYIIRQSFALHACMTISVVAVIAALEELIIHISTSKYCANRKTLFVNK